MFLDLRVVENLGTARLGFRDAGSQGVPPA
jgi:hypothetical protein